MKIKHTIKTSNKKGKTAIVLVWAKTPDIMRPHHERYILDGEVPKFNIRSEKRKELKEKAEKKGKHQFIQE